MIDFINKGNNRKIDFIILSSLFSNVLKMENFEFLHIKMIHLNSMN